jgi:hypothetical protein
MCVSEVWGAKYTVSVDPVLRNKTYCTAYEYAQAEMTFSLSVRYPNKRE